ncbi:MAG: DUF4399 domain-containing protein [Chloroflexi bacterium]|nr:DUF4399 domain-containing protein [Chloroflexota bacterium]
MRRLSIIWLPAILLVSLGLIAACGDGPAGNVGFLEPADGAEVVSPFNVRMSAEDVTVEPASKGVRDGYGHHHIVVDASLPPLDRPIPSDEQHRHFGKGQTETTLDLPPGQHTLRLLFADGSHEPYDPAVTDTIKVTVTERRGVSFAEPQDGIEVTSPFVVKMGTDGMVVEPAAEGVNAGRGHHHIVIDTDLPPVGQPIPSDDQHRHFGKGQTETTLDLPPGEHTLSLLFADGNHSPYAPALTDTVTITVVEEVAERETGD